MCETTVFLQYIFKGKDKKKIYYEPNKKGKRRNKRRMPRKKKKPEEKIQEGEGSMSKKPCCLQSLGKQIFSESGGGGEGLTEPEQ